MKTLQLALIAVTAFGLSIATSSAAEDVVVVYDASGSMWGQIDGVSKIDIAREVMDDLVNTWPEGTNLGLVAYGHRSEGDCNDIETLIEPTPLNRAHFIGAVNKIRPKGKTPISAAVQHAADLLSYRDNPATVILISDGLETCQADPCALAEQLARQGVKFTAHVVGFDLDDDAHASLSCIAENTGGVFVPAQNAAQLQEALAHVQSVMELQPMTLEQNEPAAEPELAPQMQHAVELEVPTTAITGSSFAVSWSTTLNTEDYITLVPAGSDEGTEGKYFRVREKKEGELIASAMPGLYEVRYVSRADKHILGTAQVEVIEPEIGIAAPKEVVTGSDFTVSWSSSIHQQDYVTIVPAGADEGSEGKYFRVKKDTQNTLVAPAVPGLYEVRYVLQEGRRTMASAFVEVVDAELSLSAADIARAGTSLRVSWSSSIHPQDYITIVPAGADEGAEGKYFRVRNDTENKLEVPAEPGLYEVRYVLQEGRRTLASHALEVVKSDAPLDDGAGLSAPSQASAGSIITISWTGGSYSRDQRIALARVDQADFTWISAHKVADEKTLNLQMPQEAGTYEVRYLDVSGRQVLGRTMIKVK